MRFLLAFLPVAALAHFHLDSPTARGFDEDALVQFPCGGQNTPSPNRTLWPLAGGPIQLTMEHDEAAVQVLLGLGNDVGSNFNITLVPTIQEQGIGEFCLGDVQVPTGIHVSDGMNATIQVVTNGDPTGGLYNVSLDQDPQLESGRFSCTHVPWYCSLGHSADATQCADITFSSTARPGGCTNGTNVRAVPYTGKTTNANGTSSGDQTAKPSGTGAAASSTPTGGVSSLGMVWGLLVGGGAAVIAFTL